MERLNGDRAPEALLARMGALAEPTRLRLLHLLERRELGVLELADVLRLPQSSVSRHLKALADQGFVESRRQATANLYRLAPGLDPSARRLWRLAKAESEDWQGVERDRRRLETRLAGRRDDAQRFFAGAAAGWDALRAEVYGTAFERELLLALLPPEWTVADLGCGTGTLTQALATRVGRVVGVDQSAAMLRVARRFVKNLGNVELHQAGLEALPLADGSCDAALLVLALAYVADPGPVLAEAARILKPGGRLVVVDAMPHGDEELRRRLGQVRAGLDPGPLVARLGALGLAGAAARWPLPRAPQPKGPDLFLAIARRPPGA
jgi:ArsR family transcriptional regulator